MPPIIRSTTLADQKRKLPSRHPQEFPPASAGEAAATDSATGSPHQTSSMQDLVEKARQSVLEQFRSEAESARELGRQRGLQEGRMTGREEMRQTFAEELARVKSIADKLDEALRSTIQGMENIMVEIAFEAICKILGSTAMSRDVILAQVRQLVAQAGNREKLIIHLHPGDLAALQETGVLADMQASSSQVAWVADPAIELGGCILEADSGSLDARLETQLIQLRNTLLEARRLGS